MKRIRGGRNPRAFARPPYGTDCEGKHKSCDSGFAAALAIRVTVSIPLQVSLFIVNSLMLCILPDTRLFFCAENWFFTTLIE